MWGVNNNVEKSFEEKDKSGTDNSTCSDVVFDLDLSSGSNVSLTAHDGSASSIENNTTMSIENVPSTEMYNEVIGGAFTNRQKLTSTERQLCLEHGCICGMCYNLLSQDNESPVWYFTKTIIQNCSICQTNTYMKSYQTICLGCSRRRNICFICINAPVVDETHFFNFDALITGRNGAIFNVLAEPCQRSIIRSVYKTYDALEDTSARYDNAVQTFQSLIERNKPRF